MVQLTTDLRRRGYATERQKGLLLVEKLDYLQSKLLQNVFFSLSKPLEKLGRWLNEVSQSFGPDVLFDGCQCQYEFFLMHC